MVAALDRHANHPLTGRSGCAQNQQVFRFHVRYPHTLLPVNTGFMVLVQHFILYLNLESIRSHSAGTFFQSEISG